jgi:sugar/nucleoside kinase (ribokinase family)
MMNVITCGELLIDFVSTEAGVSLAQAPAFKKAPGGAPANVAVGVARLGYRAGFIGQVGNKALRLGNAAGALTTTQLGAISSLPTMKEAKVLLQRARDDPASPGPTFVPYP